MACELPSESRGFLARVRCRAIRLLGDVLRRLPPWRRAVPAAVLALAALAPIVVFAVAAWERRWMNEDGFINLRVVRNLLDGHGPVFNLGERVEAGTSPLWIVLLSLLGALGARLEYAAVYAGMALAAAGLTFALAAGLAVVRRDDPEAGALRRAAVPIGLGVFAVLPPAWDFASSGLETGLTLAWLGGSFLVLIRLVSAPAASGGTARLRAWCSAAVLLGLGPLVRPELALYGVGFLVVLGVDFVRRRRAAGLRPLRGVLVLALCAAALPVAYQVFRMGYYAALTPNTALAKEAFGSRWDQGVLYARNFFGLYELALPLAILAAFSIDAVRAAWSRGARMSAAALAAPAICGLLHAVYVVRLGGDYMHGRMFLAPVFAFALPAAVVPLLGRGAQSNAQRIFLVAVVAAWMPICGLFFRVDRENQWGIGDERGWYVRESKEAHPVTLEDYRAFGFHRDAAWLRGIAARGCPGGTLPDGSGGAGRCERTLRVDDAGYGNLHPWQEVRPLGGAADPRVVMAVARGAVGMAGYLLGPAVHLVDRVGLTDPIAARLEIDHRGRPGHEKSLPNAWLAARFTEAAQDEDAGVSAARRALSCGPAADLDAAIREPLTAGRFLRNIGAAWRLQRLRIPADPFEAERRFCGSPARYVRSAGGQGGGPFRWHCPDGTHLAALAGTLSADGGNVSDLVPECRAPAEEAASSAKAIRGPSVGRRGAQEFRVECPAGEAVTGVHVVASRFVHDVGLLCSPLPGAATVGAPSRVGRAQGAVVGAVGTEFEIACPAGALAIGIAGRCGTLVDAVGVVCEPPATPGGGAQ